MNVRVNLSVVIIRFIWSSGIRRRMVIIIFYFKSDCIAEVGGGIGWVFSFINVKRLIGIVERFGRNSIRGIWMWWDRRGMDNNWKRDLFLE